MNADILRITDPLISDDSITEYEHLEYNPIAGTNLNDGGDITITIELQDIFTHPSKSFFLIEGELLKNDGTRYADADNITITNNGMLYLFKRIRYDLAEKEIESVQNPGQATTMLGFLAPLAVGQQAYVMVRCPSCVRPSVRASVRPCVNFFFKHLLR